jgi:hypothetical protein
VRLPLASEAFDRRFGSNRAVLTNLYAEQSREGPTDRRLVPRPGLAPWIYALAPGPIRCVIPRGDDWYVVTGTRVYKNLVQVGIIPGFGLITFDQSDNDLVLVTDGIAYLVDTAVTVITMPEETDYVVGVVFSAGRFIYGIRSGGGLWRYSDIGDATAINGLNFATAESDPDDIVALAKLGDDIIFFGEKTTEWWSPTTSVDAPFIRNGGRRYDKGLAAQFTVVTLDNTLIYVGTAQQGADLQVYRASAVPVAISNEGIEAALAACADITQASAVAIVSTGHSFYVLNIPGVGTYAYDVKTGLWGNWESFGQTTFRVQCGADGVYGDAINGKLWTIDPDRRTDGDDTIIYLASSFLAVSEGTYRLNGLRLNLKTGVGAPDGNPVVEFRYAETGGEDWSTWREASIGSPGNHPTVIWRQLGMIRPPGRSLEFRFSGGADFVPHEVTADLVKGSDRL